MAHNHPFTFGACAKLSYMAKMKPFVTLIALCATASVALAATGCANSPADWKDNGEFNCLMYEGADWCNVDGTRGEGWKWGQQNFMWGTINSWSVDGVSAFDACCACGGGQANQDCAYADCWEPIDPPYQYEGLSTTCEDAKFPSNKGPPYRRGHYWTDDYGYSCRAYATGNYCTADGQTGPGWRSDLWDPISSYANGGMDGFEACCVCGGGVQL